VTGQKKKGVHRQISQTLLGTLNMNANTYTSDSLYYIWWSSPLYSLCLINRQPGAWHELAALFAFMEETINRDIHRYWGEVFLQHFFHFSIETSFPFT
jgi:hypothetical protein